MEYLDAHVLWPGSLFLQHIDAILKAWESLIAKDKEERHAKLREKVELQRQLISKVQEQNEAMRYYKMEKKKEVY